MNNKLCRLYGVTTLDGLKAICNNEPTAGIINRLGITQITENVFGFSTVSIDYYSLARKIISVLKEFKYYEYVVIAADRLTILDTGSSDTDKKYLTMKTVVSVVDDDHNLVVAPVPMRNLMELGIHDSPVPMMFKFTQVGNNNAQIENAEVVEIHHHK